MQRAAASSRRCGSRAAGDRWWRRVWCSRSCGTMPRWAGDAPRWRPSRRSRAGEPCFASPRACSPSRSRRNRVGRRAARPAPKPAARRRSRTGDRARSRPSPAGTRPSSRPSSRSAAPGGRIATRRPAATPPSRAARCFAPGGRRCGSSAPGRRAAASRASSRRPSRRSTPSLIARTRRGARAWHRTAGPPTWTAAASRPCSSIRRCSARAAGRRSSGPRSPASSIPSDASASRSRSLSSCSCSWLSTRPGPGASRATRWSPGVPSSGVVVGGSRPQVAPGRRRRVGEGVSARFSLTPCVAGLRSAALLGV